MDVDDNDEMNGNNIESASKNGKKDSSGARGRRRTTNLVNYAKEQEFSDASDIFEDSDDSAPKTSSKKRGRPRRSDANDGGGFQDDDLFKKAAPIYSERGYDPALPPIRERFPFLPEFEPDGSPRIDVIVGRRPIDEKEDSKKNDEDDNQDEKKEDGGFSDEDDDDDDDDDEDGGTRRRRKRTSNGSKRSAKKGSPDKKDSSEIVEYEYLIKYKGRSYLHLEWKTGADLESMNKNAKTMYRRYLKKLGTGDEELEDPDFDTSFAVPQRICDEAKQEITVDLSDKELLKWEKQRAKELAAEDGDDSDEEADADKKKEGDAPTPTTSDLKEATKEGEPEQKEEQPDEDKEGTYARGFVLSALSCFQCQLIIYASAEKRSDRVAGR